MPVFISYCKNVIKKMLQLLRTIMEKYLVNIHHIMKETCNNCFGSDKYNITLLGLKNMHV